MRIAILAFAALACGAAFSGTAVASTPVEFVEEARAAHADHAKGGLKSFSAEVRLEYSSNPEVEKWKEKAKFMYSWCGPAGEDWSFGDLPKQFQESLKNTTWSLWRDITGTLFFDLIASAKDLKEDGGTVSGRSETIGEFKASFDAVSKRFDAIEFEFNKARISFRYSLAKHGDKFVPKTRILKAGDGREYPFEYSGFRKVNGFRIPTAFTVASLKGPAKLSITYVMINGSQARVEEADGEEVRGKIREMEKGWAKWTDEEKIERLGEMLEFGTDEAAEAVANFGIRDRPEKVRIEAAKILGAMKKTCVTPALLAAMKAFEKEIEPYIEVIRALGEIGDPRAVDLLSRDWWNQRIGEYGVAAARSKIQALGKIRHKAAVDALVDTFYITKDQTISELKRDLHAALVKLTGQDFKLDRKAWKDWWKKSKASFAFD